MTDRAGPVVVDAFAGSPASPDPFSCWRVRHDPHSRQALVDEFMPVVRELAHRHRYGTEPLNDLVHLAIVGLLNAIDRFDPELGVPFSSVAARSILNALNRHACGHRPEVAVRPRTTSRTRDPHARAVDRSSPH